MSTALVTGANRGLGLAFARQLLKNGWNVIATSRSANKPGGLAEVAKEYPEKLEIASLEVNDLNSIKALASRLKGRAIDLLLCNAGSNPTAIKTSKITGEEGSRVQDLADTTWYDIFQTNMIGPPRIAALLHENVKASHRKTMAFISTRMANIDENSGGAFYAYRASKGALNVAVKNLALELGPHNVVCVALHPGWVKTDLGGPNAEITADESATGLLKVLGSVKASDNGKFFDYLGNQVKF